MREYFPPALMDDGTIQARWTEGQASGVDTSFPGSLRFTELSNGAMGDLLTEAEALVLRRSKMSLTRPQMMTALADPKLGELLFGVTDFPPLISQVEAEASATTVPATAASAISALPVDQQGPARLRWLNFTIVERNSDLVALLADEVGLTDPQVDAIFEAYSQI